MRRSPRVVLLLDASRGFYRNLLSGIARYSSLNGCWTFYRRRHSYLSYKEELDPEELKKWKPDGVICSINQTELLSKLKVPMIGYDPGYYEGPIPCVVSDDSQTGCLTAEHFIGSGLRNFAFCGFNSLMWSNERRRTFCETVEKSGASVEVYKGSSRSLSWSKEEKSVKKWIRSLPKPIGMFCCNDDRAASVVEACLSLGYSVPEDISIIGADDDKMICELINPPLSSVKLATEQAGYEAAALLHRLINGTEKMQGQRVVAKATGISIRPSTDVLMVRNPHVRKALQFIRENANQPIRVSDVVDATSLCHRSLNDQFHGELGAPIRKFLTRARIDYIARLLLETELRVQEIAMTVGYEDDRHFSRYFKRATGLTPQAYRRKMAPP